MAWIWRTDIYYWITHPAFVLKSAAAILDYPTFSALRYALVILSHPFAFISRHM